MLSYIHAYHAGNHADILKHATIALIIGHLKQKAAPFTVFDSHSGSGIYNLDDERLCMTAESASGIEKLMASSEPVPEELKPFSTLAADYFSWGQYPGSPLIENELMRPGDEQILSELHPAAFRELSDYFSAKEFQEMEKKPRMHFRDGYEMLRALTPPKIRRGLAVIDPSYEDSSDFDKCAETIAEVHRKWPAGIIALWYPLLERRRTEIAQMKERISFCITEREPKILDVQLTVKNQEDLTGTAALYGSGMYVLNFPYTLDTQMKKIMPFLSRTLGETAHEWSVETV